jgi:hypothetical protein
MWYLCHPPKVLSEGLILGLARPLTALATGGRN